jgi:hypothetical protein
VIPVTAAGLGINVSDPTGHGLYKWLLASFLIGKRIRSSFAVEEYRTWLIGMAWIRRRSWPAVPIGIS